MGGTARLHARRSDGHRGHHNDLEMLSFAGIPVVMGNSVPSLKTYGWHETGTNDENGVALAIEQFALREAAPCV